MTGIALNLRGAAVLHRDQNAASIGAIVRTRGMNDLFHTLRLYGQVQEKRAAGGRSEREIYGAAE
jgi:hypothetical protein